MGFLVVVGFVVILQLVGGMFGRDVHFNDNYVAVWGELDGHFSTSYLGREVQLALDNSSGAGFQSKLSYGSGFFYLRIKLPGTNTADVVTTFYLKSGEERHDELDFEFLGNVQGKPIRLQTNVFADGGGNREQRIILWFDPTADYHDYKILWNHHQIVFYVDDVPIRVFKNNRKHGVPYPTQPMTIYGTLWNADWGTGDATIDWSYAPFRAYYQGFDISGCNPQSSIKDCYAIKSSNYWWNGRKYWELDSNEQQAYENVRKLYMTYDYCQDFIRFNGTPTECFFNS